MKAEDMSREALLHALDFARPNETKFSKVTCPQCGVDMFDVDVKIFGIYRADDGYIYGTYLIHSQDCKCEASTIVTTARLSLAYVKGDGAPL